MILKTCTKEKFFGKIYLKAIRDTFFQYVVCNQGRDGVRHERKGEDLLFYYSEHSPVPHLVVNPDPP